MPISLHTLNDFEISMIGEKENKWICSVVKDYSFHLGDLNFIFCSDEQLLKMNQDFLNHNTYTDIITFDNVIGSLLSGDIYISTDRVKENAQTYSVSFYDELCRVMVHGVLHLTGQGDKEESDKMEMRRLESHYLDRR